jgi:hypothetical protein
VSPSDRSTRGLREAISSPSRPSTPPSETSPSEVAPGPRKIGAAPIRPRAMVEVQQEAGSLSPLHCPLFIPSADPVVSEK